MKGGNGLVFLSFSSRLTLIGLQDGQRKKGDEVKRRKLCVFCFCFLYNFFPCRLCLGEGEESLGEELWMGPDRKCLEAHPQDLLFVFRLWHWLLQHLHFYTIMSLKKQSTERILSSCFCLLLSKKMEPNFKCMLLLLRNTRGTIKKVFLQLLSMLSDCSPWCSAVYTPSHHFLCLCVY